MKNLHSFGASAPLAIAQRLLAEHASIAATDDHERLRAYVLWLRGFGMVQGHQSFNAYWWTLRNQLPSELDPSAADVVLVDTRVPVITLSGLLGVCCSREDIFSGPDREVYWGRVTFQPVRGGIRRAQEAVGDNQPSGMTAYDLLAAVAQSVNLPAHLYLPGTTVGGEFALYVRDVQGGQRLCLSSEMIDDGFASRLLYVGHIERERSTRSSLPISTSRHCISTT